MHPVAITNPQSPIPNPVPNDRPRLQLRSQDLRIPPVRRVGKRRAFQAARRRPAVHDPAAAAERHRHPAHGPCVPADPDGRVDPLPPHARVRHPVAGRHRSRRHRHRNGGGAQPEPGEPHPRWSRPRRFHRQGVGMEGRVRRHHRTADAPPGHLGRLVAQHLHHGSGTVARGDRGIRALARGRPDLPRPAPGQLGSGAEDRDLGPGSGKRRGRRLPVVDRLPARRRQR